MRLCRSTAWSTTKAICQSQKCKVNKTMTRADLTMQLVSCTVQYQGEDDLNDMIRHNLQWDLRARKQLLQYDGRYGNESLVSCVMSRWETENNLVYQKYRIACNFLLHLVTQYSTGSSTTIDDEMRTIKQTVDFSFVYHVDRTAHAI